MLTFLLSISMQPKNKRLLSDYLSSSDIFLLKINKDTILYSRD